MRSCFPLPDLNLSFACDEPALPSCPIPSVPACGAPQCEAKRSGPGTVGPLSSEDAVQHTALAGSQRATSQSPIREVTKACSTDDKPAAPTVTTAASLFTSYFELKASMAARGWQGSHTTSTPGSMKAASLTHRVHEGRTRGQGAPAAQRHVQRLSPLSTVPDVSKHHAHPEEPEPAAAEVQTQWLSRPSVPDVSKQLADAMAKKGLGDTAVPRQGWARLLVAESCGPEVFDLVKAEAEASRRKR